MWRIGSLLMMFLVTVPLVRDCCLVAQLPPCHQSKQHTDDSSCFTNQQAITETKAALHVSSIDHWCEIAHDPISAIVLLVRGTSETLRSPPAPMGAIYLRTGALLI